MDQVFVPNLSGYDLDALSAGHLLDYEPSDQVLREMLQNNWRNRVQSPSLLSSYLVSCQGCCHLNRPPPLPSLSILASTLGKDVRAGQAPFSSKYAKILAGVL